MNTTLILHMIYFIYEYKGIHTLSSFNVPESGLVLKIQSITPLPN